MSTKNVLQPLQVNNANMDRSPARKRARFVSPHKERWSLNNTVKLDEVFDFGVRRLKDDSDTLSDSENGENIDNISNPSDPTDTNCSPLPPSPPIGGNTPKQDTQNISIEEWDGFLIKKADIEPVTIDYFSLLSDEVVLHIFNFLPKRQLLRASAVCSRFHRLSRDESLWTRIDAAGRVLAPGSLGRILSRQVIVLRLAQSEIQGPILDAESPAACETFQARLMYLDAGMIYCEPTQIATLFSKCRRLRKVSLERVVLNAEVFKMLALNVDLEVLNLAMAEGINVEGLKALLTNCRKLRELNVAWTYLDAASIKYLCANLPSSIDRLNISGCRKLLTDSNIGDLVKSCPSLRELDLSDCTGLTGNAIQHIIQLRDLNFLALSRCYLIPYRALLSLKKSESLLFIDVHGGYIELAELQKLQEILGSNVQVNKFKFSSVARPTVGVRRASIWNLRVRD